MKPFINIFGYDISMYALCSLIGITLGTSIAAFRCKNKSLRQDVVFSILYGVIGLLIGAKLLYIIQNIKTLIYCVINIETCYSDIVAMFQGGFVFYGGLIGALIAIYMYCRRYKLNYFKIVEIIIPSIPIVHAFGRLGCFCAGCCYGIPFDKPIGMFFNNSPVAPHNISLFPVQLLEALLNIFLFIALMIFSRKERKSGSILCFYIIGYSIIRFITEFFRFDEIRGIILGIPFSQFISILLFVIAIVFLFIRRLNKIS